MKQALKSASAAFIAGLVFGVGLLLAGMANPAKVLAFLDITGAWDPSLALVMAAAIPLAMLAFTVSRRCTKPMIEDSFQWPQASQITPALLIGSTLFGIGWGLAGICPGPALVLVGAGYTEAVVFVACMLIGMYAAAPLKNMLEPKT
ncbi:YeeE/YedE family protein [Rheinheimera sp.]|uniref:YeeE/YedE family protein n=1 Tax=Rheinheimera sp. TaxID=1869214 RepID=UPI00307D09B0